MRLSVRLPNWVGDVCMSLPALAALERAGVDLDCYGRSWAPGLLAALPRRTRALPRALRPGAAVLRRHAARRVLLMTGSFSSAAMVRLASRLPLGTAGDGRRFLLHRRLPPAPPGHETRRFWHLAQSSAVCLGLDPGSFASGPPSPQLPVPATAVRTAAGLAGDLPRPWVLLCPTATGTVGGRDKRWPGFAGLAERLWADGVGCVCCPGPGEEVACRDVAPRARHLTGVDLTGLAALLALADAVVANDSGPMHLAAAVGGRVFGIFGASDPAHYAPVGGTAIGDGLRWPAVEAVRDRLTTALAEPHSSVTCPERPA